LRIQFKFFDFGHNSGGSIGGTFGGGYGGGEGGRGVQALQGSVQLGANPVQVSPHPLDIQGYGPPIPLQLLVLLQHGLQHSLLLDYLANSVMLVETLGTLRPMVHNGLDRRQ